MLATSSARKADVQARENSCVRHAFGHINILVLDISGTLIFVLWSASSEPIFFIRIAKAMLKGVT